MLLENYSSQGLLTVATVLGETGAKGKYAFRGDLVLEEGELKEGSERDRKPPRFLIHQAVILADDDKFLFVSGLLNELDKLAMFVDKYKEALSTETFCLLFVENIEENMTLQFEGLSFQLIPYSEGLIWNELLELLYLEKSDLKGQSAEDKVITVFDAAKGLKSAGDTLSYEAALGKTVEVVKEMASGPV